MDIASLFQMAMFQLVTARESPIPIVLACLLVMPIVWWLTRWRYKATIQNLKRAIVRRDAELANLRAHIPMGTEGLDDIAADQVAPPRAAVPRSDDQRALRLVVNTIDQAGLALRSGDAREIDRAQSSMGLALQTVSRQFGLPVPGLGTTSTDSLAIGQRYLEQVRPALRAGDQDEARRLASAFLASGATGRMSERTPITD